MSARCPAILVAALVSGALPAAFDAAVRDPRDPKRFRPEADSPDLLHPGDAGYRLMAQAFDLSLFAARR